jgi:predicted ATPase
MPSKAPGSQGNEKGHVSDILWRIRLFDGPTLEDREGRQIHRFRSQRVGALLAFLASPVGRSVPREEIYEALWPGEDTLVVANRLRVALNSLRHHLEFSPEIPFGSVLDVSDRGRVRLRSEVVWCDTVAFEQAFRRGDKQGAARLADGTYLPGYYDSWVIVERERLDAIRERLEPIQASVPDAEIDVTPPGPPTSFGKTQAAHLPFYLTRFFGRSDEKTHLCSLAEQHRLVTVTGPGGVGKTRLVVETVRQYFPASRFVSLSVLREAERVPETVLRALDILPRADTDPTQHLILVLQRQEPLLLVLDNAEHLLASVTTLALRLLQAVPSLRLLITSRQRLNLPGEAWLPLSPLAIPLDVTDPDERMALPVIVMFLDRARLSRPDFSVPAARMPSLIEICQRLDGMPLGIELAAARVSSQSLPQIADSLKEHLTHLESRQHGRSERHRSLRNVVQGSIELLSPILRSFFAPLTVFRGGWTAAAAHAVTGYADVESLLEDLSVRSLVVVQEEAGSDGYRYTLLETLRQFATELLTDKQKELCRERHAAYYLSLAAKIDDDDTRPLLLLDAEQENLLSAMEWGRKTGSNDYWQGVVGALHYAYIRGHQRSAALWAEDALTDIASVSDARLRFQVRHAASSVLVDLGRLDDSRRLIEQMQADCDESRNSVDSAFVDNYRGFVAENAGEIESAVQILQGVLEKARYFGNRRLLMTSLSLTSSALISKGREFGGDSSQGKAILKEADRLAVELLGIVSPYSRRIALAKLLRFMALSEMDKEPEAYILLKETQFAALTHRTRTILMYTFIYEAQIAIKSGHAEQAALLYGAFSLLQEQMGYSVRTIQSAEPDWTQKIESMIRAALGSERFEVLQYQGRQTPPSELTTNETPRI